MVNIFIYEWLSFEYYKHKLKNQKDGNMVTDCFWYMDCYFKLENVLYNLKRYYKSFLKEEYRDIAEKNKIYKDSIKKCEILIKTIGNSE